MALGGMAMNEFEGVIPILRVKNFGEAMEYYVTKLGFKRSGIGERRQRSGV